MSVTREKLHALTQAIPYKTRTGHRGAQLAYIDARDAMDLLDEVVGPENWQCDYKQVKNVVYCGIGINTDEAGWVWKWDAGDESNIEEEKGEASDSFKRAAVRWGIGRFLYRLGSNPKPAQPQQQYTKPVQAQAPKSEPLVSDQIKANLLAQAKRCCIEQENWNAMVKGRGIKWSVMTQAQAIMLSKHLDSIEASLKVESAI